ncbi:MAG: hypothetical protein F4X75_22320 [Gemmatimonadetes bacterium]|nr:hypothetical protein [Gemmatimonadota bacterium]
MDYKIVASVANPGSALGEAIGSSMEDAIKKLLNEIADQYGCHYLTSGVRKTKSGKKQKKLLMSDKSGNEYDIDGVLANQSMKPLIIFESKYIRYKKHNRDKGSWICHAHSAIRRRYHSIRSSIAILAGNWSSPSQAMMRSNNINLFLIPFNHICEVLSELGIDFDWEEKDRDKAIRAWGNFNKLNSEQKKSIGIKMIDPIKDNLVILIENILDDTVEREVDKVLVELISNLGEVKVYEFESISDALDFLQDDGLKDLFLTTDSDSLFDPPPDLFEEP